MTNDELTPLSAMPPSDRAHAIKMLNSMPILNESARSLGTRAAKVGAPPARIVFHSPDQPDVVLVASQQGGRLEVAERAADGDATLTTDAANRLLVLWGRKSSDRRIAVDGDPTIIDTLQTVLWPNAQPWPRANTAATP